MAFRFVIPGMGFGPNPRPSSLGAETVWRRIAGFLLGARAETETLNQADQSLRIMPMGDSITEGFQVPGGYRNPLYDILTNWGYNVDYVGRYSQDGDPTPDPNHWGRPGLGIADTDAIIGGKSYVSLQANEGPEGAVRQGLLNELERAISPIYFSPDPDVTNILLLMLGTNDIVHQVVEKSGGAMPAGDRNNDGKGEQQDRIAESNFYRFNFFVDRVNEQAQKNGLNLKVLIGTVPDINNGWNQNGLKDPISPVMRSELRQYNSFILNEFQDRTYTNIDVNVVDIFSAVGPSLADGIHPSPQGHWQMAETWASGIEQILA